MKITVTDDDIFLTSPLNDDNEVHKNQSFTRHTQEIYQFEKLSTYKKKPKNSGARVAITYKNLH